MKYANCTKEQLIQRIEELEALNWKLLKETEQKTYQVYGFTSRLGHWYWNLRTNYITFNPLKINTLGYEQEKVPEHFTYPFFTKNLHPEDYQKTLDAMYAHLSGKVPVYEVEYRIQTRHGTYKWYHVRGQITQYDDSGKPLFVSGIVFDISDMKEQQVKIELINKILREQSTIDGLTQISNHRALIENLKNQIEHANKTKEPLSLAIFDIDNFKDVNDINGHIIGDAVLADIAAIIQKNIRETDLAGRYGGDEFMIIFPNTSLIATQTITERIRQAVENYVFMDELRVTISGGVKQYDNETFKDLIHFADMNLYKAKRKGKNNVL